MGFSAAGVDFEKNRAVTMETVKYLKTLKGARVAPGGFGFRTLSSTYISNKKNYTPQSKVMTETPVPLQDYNVHARKLKAV